MSDTYCADTDILAEDRWATRALHPDDAGKFDRHRALVNAQIVTYFEQREPPVNLPSAGVPELLGVEVAGVLAMAYREAMSSPSGSDLFKTQMEAWQKQYDRRLDNVRLTGASSGDGVGMVDDIGQADGIECGRG